MRIISEPQKQVGIKEYVVNCVSCLAYLGVMSNEFTPRPYAGKDAVSINCPNCNHFILVNQSHLDTTERTEHVVWTPSKLFNLNSQYYWRY